MKTGCSLNFLNVKTTNIVVRTDVFVNGNHLLISGYIPPLQFCPHQQRNGLIKNSGLSFLNCNLLFPKRLSMNTAMPSL